MDDSLERAVEIYGGMVYRLAFARTGNKCDAEDIFQEVFMRYLRKMPRFETEEHRKAWLIRVTVNCAKKLWASPWRRYTRPLEETLPFETPEERDLYDEIQRLPPQYRAVIHLYYYEELSTEEIAAALNRKPATVRNQLTRARYKLRDILREGESNAERDLPEDV